MLKITRRQLERGGGEPFGNDMLFTSCHPGVKRRGVFAMAISPKVDEC